MARGVGAAGGAGRGGDCALGRAAHQVRGRAQHAQAARDRGVKGGRGPPAADAHRRRHRRRHRRASGEAAAADAAATACTGGGDRRGAPRCSARAASGAGSRGRGRPTAGARAGAAGSSPPPPETTGSMRPTDDDDDDDDDDDYGDGDDDVRAPPSMGVPSGGSAAAAEDGDGDATLSLRIVGTLEPGSVLRLIEGRAADPSERRDVRDASTTEWFRMPRGGASSAADPASEAPVWRGATYQCSAEDVGYVICASVGGRMASAPKPIAPNRMALTHIQGKLEQGRHEFRATDAASGALLLVVLTRAKIEVVPSPTEAATAGEAAGGARKKAKAKEAKPLLSAAWGGGGVALRFALGTDDELTVHAGVHARKAKHHTSVAVKLGNSQQRDLLLLAACAHANPAGYSRRSPASRPKSARSPSSAGHLLPQSLRGGGVRAGGGGGSSAGRLAALLHPRAGRGGRRTRRTSDAPAREQCRFRSTGRRQVDVDPRARAQLRPWEEEEAVSDGPASAHGLMQGACPPDRKT